MSPPSMLKGILVAPPKKKRCSLDANNTGHSELLLTIPP